jgi:hypothetical protein
LLAFSHLFAPRHFQISSSVRALKLSQPSILRVQKYTGRF